MKQYLSLVYRNDFICKLINMIYHIKKLKNKKHMNISVCAEKTFNKIQYPFMIKSKSSIEGMSLKSIKVVYEKSIANIQVNAEKWEAFPVKYGTR